MKELQMAVKVMVVVGSLEPLGVCTLLCGCEISMERFKRSEFLYMVLVFRVRIYFVLNLFTIHVAGQVSSFSSRSSD